MPISKQSVEKLFAEQLDRPIDPSLAEAVAGIASSVIDALNAVDPATLSQVEPTMTFQPSYPEQEEATAWQLNEL